MQIYPHELCNSHSVSDLLAQLMISRRGEGLPTTWNHYELGNFTLSCCPSAPCAEIRTENGRLNGYCVGYYITDSGELLGKLDVPQGTVTEDDIEEFIAGLSGCFIVFIEVNGEPRIYLDPCGSSPMG